MDRIEQDLQFTQFGQTVQILQTLYLVVMQVQMSQIGRKFQILDFFQVVIVQINDC